MTTIHRRTAFVDTTGEVVRFLPWNMVVTNLGTMFEPAAFTNVRPGGVQVDPMEECAKIDKLESAQIDHEWTYLTGAGNPVVHGGRLVPTNYTL